MAGIKQITDVIYLNLSIIYYYIEISRFRRAAIRLANMSQVALFSGSGLSRVIVSNDIYSLVFNNILESTIYSIKSNNGKMIFNKDDVDNAIKGLDVLGIGVGWDFDDEYKKILEYVLLSKEIIVVIDADGLNVLSKMDLNILNKSKCKIVLTPHVKEFSRLVNIEVNDIINNPINYVRSFVNKYNVTLLLKGPTTIIADCKDLYLSNTGCSGMATAGSGDVLTGIICGVLGFSNSDILLSVASAAYVNGLAGELASKKYGNVSMVARDTIDMIRFVIKEIENYDS